MMKTISPKVDVPRNPYRVWKPEETERQLLIVYSGMVQGATPFAIRKSLRAEFPRMGIRRYEILHQRVQAQLNQEEKEAGATRRAEAIRRIQARIQALDTRAREYEHPPMPGGKFRQPTDHDLKMARLLFAEARQQDALLATITGITAPIKIEVESKVRETVTVLMAQMTPEQISINLARYKETEKLAEIGRQKLLPEKVNGVHTNGIPKPR